MKNIIWPQRGMWGHANYINENYRGIFHEAKTKMKDFWKNI